MANITLTALNPVAVTGVNADPQISYDWNIKTDVLTATAAIADVIYTPTLDLIQANPKCNRVAFQKIGNIVSPDVLAIQTSVDGTNWYTAPIYNGGVAGGTATSAVSIAELALVGLPSMRYVRGAITLAGTAMAGRTTQRIAVALLRL